MTQILNQEQFLKLFISQKMTMDVLRFFEIKKRIFMKKDDIISSYC